VNVDYILMLVEKHLKARGSGQDKEILATIERAVNASPTLRSKKDLIDDFVESVSNRGRVGDQWTAFIAARREAELEGIIADEGLNAGATKAFMDAAFRDGGVPTTGTAIADVMPPISRFAGDGTHAARKRAILARLAAFLERYLGLA
jgi:type I restriction enzyme R subunit